MNIAKWFTQELEEEIEEGKPEYDLRMSSITLSPWVLQVRGPSGEHMGYLLWRDDHWEPCQLEETSDGRLLVTLL